MLRTADNWSIAVSNYIHATHATAVDELINAALDIWAQSVVAVKPA